MTEALVPTLHSRAHRTNRYVYVVRSRRAGGVSVGINLDPQKTCNFDCVYCEVIDRKAIARKTGRPPVEAGDVLVELARQLVEDVAGLHGRAATSSTSWRASSTPSRRGTSR